MAAINNAGFWDKVANTPSNYRPNDQVIIGGRLISERAEDLRDKMYSECSSLDLLARKLFQTPPKQVLDLGSGIGRNSLPMACQGAKVTAIDSSRELLEIFSRKSKVEGCPTENIRLRRGDITTAKSYGENFDLVLAVDVLPYLAPKDLKSTMEKIHQCLAEGGILIGTIFTTDDNKPYLLNELMEKIGVHNYEGNEQFVKQLLTESKFSAEIIERRQEGGFRFKAKKIS